MLLGATVFAISSNACPLCLAPSQTWAEMVSDADVVLLAHLISRDEGSAKSPPFSLVKVLEVHKGKVHLTSKELLRIEEYIFAEEGDLVLLKGSLQDAAAAKFTETFATDLPKSCPLDASKKIQKVSATEVTEKPNLESGEQTLRWDFYEKGTREGFEYLTTAPGPDGETTERLLYFLPFLEHADTLIATDAWSEFANAEYDEIKKVSDSFSAKKLRQWISDPNSELERRGLYGLMLGMCGTQDDADFLREQIGQPGGDINVGAEGLMGGLLVLAGDAGLQFLEDSRLTNEKATAFDCFPVIQALQFAWTYEPTLFEKERLRIALRPLLKQEDVREVVITDLARWEDWNATKLMADVYLESKSDDARTVQAVASFLILCQQCETDENSDNAASAGKLIEKIRKDHARAVRMAEDEFGQ